MNESIKKLPWSSTQHIWSVLQHWLATPGLRIYLSCYFRLKGFGEPGNTMT